MEVPLEARIPTASFDRGENLDLERKSGLLTVTQLPVAELGQELSAQCSFHLASSYPAGEAERQGEL